MNNSSVGNLATSMMADVTTYGRQLKGWSKFIWYIFMPIKRWTDGYKSGWNAAEQLYQNNAVNKQYWNSITILPPNIGSYLVFLEDCMICMAFYNSNGEWIEMWSQQKLKVKRWMYLPKSPY
jgi:hypothetical protein